MKAEFINQEKPDVQITISYQQAQKLEFVLFHINGSDDLDDLWCALEKLEMDKLETLKFDGVTSIRVIEDE